MGGEEARESPGIIREGSQSHTFGVKMGEFRKKVGMLALVRVSEAGMRRAALA